MNVRDYTNSDIAAISRLYYETVRSINVRDYRPEQIEVWAPEIYDNQFWKARFRNYRVFVAEDRGEIIGFAEFERTGHIDCFYAHHLWQGRGIGTALLRHIEQHAADSNIQRLFADISITARPFFLRHGFRLVKAQNRAYWGLLFKQFFMEKGLE